MGVAYQIEDLGNTPPYIDTPMVRFVHKARFLLFMSTEKIVQVVQTEPFRGHPKAYEIRQAVKFVRMVHFLLLILVEF